MSTRVESPPVGGGFGGTLALAVVVALSVGAFVGSLVTHAIDSDGGTLSPTFVARGTPALTAVDVGNGSKSIEGPMLAERFNGLGSANVWDVGNGSKSIEGPMLAERFFGDDTKSPHPAPRPRPQADRGARLPRSGAD